MKQPIERSSCRRAGSLSWARAAAAACLAIALLAAPSQAQADGFDSNVSIHNGTSLEAGPGGAATNNIGCGDVDIGGSGVNTRATAGQRADTSIGSCGDVSIGGGIDNRNGQQHIGGNSSIGGRTITGDGATLGIGNNDSSVYVGQDVYVPRGSLSIGGTGRCVAVRNNRCCVDVHWGTCVLNIVPPGKHGCPPRYTYTGGVCRLFYNFGGHRIEGY